MSKNFNWNGLAESVSKSVDDELDDDSQPALHHLESKLVSDWANSIMQIRSEDVPRPKDPPTCDSVPASMDSISPPRQGESQSADKDVSSSVDTRDLDSFSFVYPPGVGTKQRRIINSMIKNLLDFFDCEYSIKDTPCGMVITNTEPETDDEVPPLEEACESIHTSKNGQMISVIISRLRNGLVLEKKIGKGSVKVDYTTLKIPDNIQCPEEPFLDLQSAYNWLIKKSPRYHMIQSMYKPVVFP
ncbi:phosphoprotein [Gray Lodge virus]|uniref:Phosphoprotein n=1 Tax=Gray Lodge virus TaxID=1272942 RepID=A0A0D3R299_9RHAB|nr:phosphoprotein [Gray Lodge virus]AJR28575.1 phosphoprotein [Gray Lodge virus]